MKYDRSFFDRGLERKNTNCEKWDGLRGFPPDTVPLGVADMDFAVAEEVTQAVTERAAHPNYGYTFQSDAEKRAAADFWHRRHGTDFTAEETVLLPCVITGQKTCVQLFSEPGERIAVLSPVYGPFFSSVTLNGREVAECPVRQGADGVWRMDYDRIEAAFREGARMLLLCNPHNPLSRCWKRDELEQLLALAHRWGVTVVSDEIHADFVYAPDEFVSVQSFEAYREDCVSLFAASKTFNIAGLQIAHAAAYDRKKREAIRRRLIENGAVCGNIFAVRAESAAFEYGDAWLDGVTAYLTGNRNLLLKTAKELMPKAKVSPISATYLAWFDLTDYNIPCDRMQEAFRKAGAAVVPGSVFGKGNENFVRVNFGCPEAQMLEGLERMAKALKEA